MKLTPKLIPGSLHIQNKGSCDWGWQSIFAYGCHNFVVVVDPETVQNIQTLDLHQSNVVKVKWCRENYHHDLGCPYSLRLASADVTGHIIIWDVSQGISLSEFSDGSKPVLDLHWLWTQDASHDLVAALHAPSSLVLWNADTGIKLWKKTFQENLICFAFDPFSPAKVTLMSQEYLVFLSDFSVNQAPEGNGRRFYMTSSESSTGSSSNLLGSGNWSNISRTPSKSAFERVKLWAANESKTRMEEINVALSECLQLVYHPSRRDLILLTFPREILFIDTAINQAIGSIYLERNSPSFTHAVLPCTQRDVLYTLHDNGSITMRCRRQVTSNPYPTNSPETEDIYSDIIYENKCQSDTFRLSKSNYVSGFVVCPVTETKVILLVSDGRLLIWNVKTTGDSLSDTMLMSDECLKASLPLAASDSPIISALVSPPDRTLADILPASMQQGGVRNSFRFLLVGLLSNVQASPNCAAMCPPMTTKNWPEYKPLVAVGGTSGSVQVFDLSVGLMIREFNLHSSPVRGIVWCSLTSLLSWSYWSHSSSVRSEVFMVDLKTGQHAPLPLSKNSEEKTVMSIKVSQLKQYFAIVYKEKPLEIWDLKNLCLLREMSTHFPLISALEWSPSHFSKHKKKQAQQAEPDKNAEGSEEKAANVLDSGKTELTTTPVWLKEHFIFTNTDGMLFHYVVEGTSVKDSSRVPPDGSMGNITSITWKSDTVILGDADGNFSIWELKHRLSRNQSTHRGAIKKMKYAPGRGNVKLMLQFNDGVEIWDLGKSERTSSLRTVRDSVSIVDIEWYSSEVPLLLFSNGTMRMMDINLKRSCSPMSEQDLTDSLWCPHLLPPRKALMFKSILQNQNWNGKYTFDMDELNLSSQEKKDQMTGLLSNLSDDVKDFLPEAPLGTAQRCLTVAQLYGDEGELRFWSVTLHYLRREKCRKVCPAYKNGGSKTSRSSSRLGPCNFSETEMEVRRPRGKSLDLLSIDDDLDLNIPLDSDVEEPCCCFPLVLDTGYDILCDSRTFQTYQLNRVALHDSKRSTYEHTKKCAETLVLLKQSDRAVQLFLETEANNPNYYTDSLRACLVAAIRSSGASQSTIKLVATNLIANGKLDEGVQLLCMIDKGLDACRYLQTYGKWDQAAWLAKATLDYNDCAEVMRRWIEHLSGTHISQQSRGLLLFISLGQFKKALLMVFGMRFFDRAALFAEACLEYGLLATEDSSVSLLLESVFTEYARYLYTIGLVNAAKYYCNKGGQEGKRLLSDIS